MGSGADSDGWLSERLGKNEQPKKKRKKRVRHEVMENALSRGRRPRKMG